MIFLQLKSKNTTIQKGLIEAGCEDRIDHAISTKLVSQAIEDEKEVIKNFYALIKD